MDVWSPSQLVSGSPVEVWCPISGEWSHGFCLERMEHGAAVLRRVSDGQVLPVALPLERVRVPTPVSSWDAH